MNGRRWSAFRQGILSNLLNPKVALFFLALMPQFISAGSTNKVGAFLVLGLSFVALGVLWCLVLAIGAAHLRGAFLRRPSMAIDAQQGRRRDVHCAGTEARDGPAMNAIPRPQDSGRKAGASA